MVKKCRKNLIVLLIAPTLFGCGGVAAIRTMRNDMENSKAAYTQCLQQHPNDLSQCEELRRIYEADLKAYRALCDAIRPADTISIDNNE